MRVVVLGVGNILMSDEGVGVHAVQQLQREYRLPGEVEAIDGGTSAMELLEDMACADHLILLDAVKTGREPGTVVRLVDDEVPAFFRTKLSPHQVGLSDVLATLQLTEESPRRVTLIGVVPASMAMGMELTDTIAQRVPEVLGLVLDELRAMGLTVSPAAG